MKDIFYFEKDDDYVLVMDHYGKEGIKFIVEARINNHKHEDEFPRLFEACKAFNAIVASIQIDTK